jgi:hypothetical protein
VAVIRANHGQAGEPAFSCFGLLHNREVAPAAEIQEAGHGHIETSPSNWTCTPGIGD